MTDVQPVDPSAELRALYLELTAALVRAEGILQPTIEKARRAYRLLNDEGKEALTTIGVENIPDRNETNWWHWWMIGAGENDATAALDRVCEILHEYCPGSELP